MILAAAACAAAGISYIFNDDEQSTKTKYETVTASSTIIDQQGVLKYGIYPQMKYPYSHLYHSLFNEEQKVMSSMVMKCKTKQLEVPTEKTKQINHYKRDFSIVFFWSVPLKARLLQIPTRSSIIMENLNPFQHHSMKISIGTQNGINENTPSEIALSCSDHTLDSLSYNPHLIPMGVLKKKKFDLYERETKEKRFRLDPDLTEEKIMKDMILNNVNLCVENLSKILSESCSNTEEQLTTLHNSSSLLSPINNNQSIAPEICNHNHSKLFKPEEDLISSQVYLNTTKHDRTQLFDGVILHRGEQFGIALGEPMARRSHTNENLSIDSSHSITELYKLFSKTSCFLMRQYQIESIEDLIRLFLEQGQVHFTDLMINLFKIEPFIAEQLNIILLKWAKQLT